MPTTAWSTARNAIARELGYYSFTSTNITTTTVVSAALENVYDVDSGLVGWLVLVEAGSNAGLIRRVSTYTADGGTLAQTGVVWTADATARACSLHRFNPITMQNHFNEAVVALFPHVAIIRDIQTLISGQHQRQYPLSTTLRGKPLAVWVDERNYEAALGANVLTNGDFATWTNSTTPGTWVLAGSGSVVTREDQASAGDNYAVLFGTYSAKVVAALNTATTLLQTVTPTVAAEGMESNLAIWVYCETASRVSATLQGSNVVSTPVLGSTHGGGGWERLTVSALTNSAATTFSAGINVTSGAAVACYVDSAVCLIGQTEAIASLWTPLLRWTWIPAAAGASNNGFLEFPYDLPIKRPLRIRGVAPLSTVSADTDTFELSNEELDIVYNETRRRMIMEALGNMPLQDRPYWHSRAQEYEAKVRRALDEGRGSRRDAAQLMIPTWSY